MQLSDFDYELPEELVAQHPPAERDAARMLLVDRRTREWRDSTFASLPGRLSAKDVLVLNNTRVFPARLVGRRVPTGGKVELLLLREIESNVWSTLTRPARRLRNGAQIKFGESQLQALVIESLDDGVRLVRFESARPLDQIIDQIGQTPLPPSTTPPAPPTTAPDRSRPLWPPQRMVALPRRDSRRVTKPPCKPRRAGRANHAARGLRDL